MRNLLKDIRVSMRSLLRSPAFTALGVLTLGIGAAANTVVFSLVDAVLLRPLPFAEPAGLVRIWETNRRENLERFPVSVPNFLDWRRESRSFETFAAFMSAGLSLTGLEHPEHVKVAYVSPSFFPLLRVRPLLGRSFQPEEEQSGRDHVVLLGHGVWQRLFGSSPQAVGRTLTLGNESYIVIGVLPVDFKFPFADAEIWAPFSIDLRALPNRGNHFFHVIARLKPGVTVAAAQNEMNAITAQLAKEYPNVNSGWTASLVSFINVITEKIRPVLAMLLVAVGLLMLIACGNVANLLLARMAGREREIAVRATLGASRRQLVQQLITENLLLAACGGTLGLVIAFWCLRVLVSSRLESVPRIEEIGLHLRPAGFSLLAVLAAALLSGLIPALRAARPNLTEGLKEGARGVTALRGRHLRDMLVVAELALASILLIGAALIVRSVVRLQEVDPGFNHQNVLIARLSLPQSRYSGQQIVDFYQRLFERVRTLPGVKSIGSVTHLPMVDWFYNFIIEGRPKPADSADQRAIYRVVDGDYFRVLEIPLQRGRLFSTRDSIKAPNVIVVNEAFAKQFFPAGDALGKRIGLDEPPQWYEVVGVVGNVRERGVDVEVPSIIYTPQSQYQFGLVYLMIHTTSDPMLLVPELRNAVAELDRNLPLYEIRSMNDLLASALAQRRFNALLLIIFAGSALLLAVVGTYGVVSYSVEIRRHEMGTRLALGAQPRDLLRGVLRDSLKLIVQGVAIGAVGAFAATRLLRGFLFGVSASDPLSFVAVSLLLALIAILACYLPAKRATRVDPIVALRYE